MIPYALNACPQHFIHNIRKSWHVGDRRIWTHLCVLILNGMTYFGCVSLVTGEAVYGNEWSMAAALLARLSSSVYWLLHCPPPFPRYLRRCSTVLNTSLLSVCFLVTPGHRWITQARCQSLAPVNRLLVNVNSCVIMQDHDLPCQSKKLVWMQPEW